MNTDTRTNRRTPAAARRRPAGPRASPSIALVASVSAAAAGTGAEDDGVGALQGLRQLLRRGGGQVQHQRLDPGRLEVRRLPGVADQPDRLVPPLGEQGAEPQPDLSMASGDDGPHGPPHRAVIERTFEERSTLAP